jgi:hypothetical protein
VTNEDKANLFARCLLAGMSFERAAIIVEATTYFLGYLQTGAGPDLAYVAVEDRIRDVFSLPDEQPALDRQDWARIANYPECSTQN